jgi:hypothetical protein
MKKLQGLGRSLSKIEQKKIIGGDQDYCAEVTCWDSNHNELGTIYAMRSQASQWLSLCNAQYSGTTTTSGSDCGCTNCS